MVKQNMHASILFLNMQKWDYVILKFVFTKTQNRVFVLYSYKFHLL